MRFYLLRTLFVLLLLLYCVSGSVAVTEYHRCMHEFINPIVGPAEVDIRRSHIPTIRKSDVLSADEALKESERTSPTVGWEKIRIRIFADDLQKKSRFCANKGAKILNDLGDEVECAEEDVLTPEKKDILVNVILKEAVQLHTERLRVKPLKDPLVVPKFTAGSVCANFTVPDEHRTDGVADADMVLYVAAAPMIYPRSFAWAAACAILDNKRGGVSNPGRPVVGVMNYAPRHIMATAQRVRVAAHEIAHALGFSVDEMKRLGMVEDVEKVRGKTTKVSVVSAPNTLRETRWQYNCNTTKGMELEDHPSLPPIRRGGGSPQEGRGHFVGRAPTIQQRFTGRPGPPGMGLQGKQRMHQRSARGGQFPTAGLGNQELYGGREDRRLRSTGIPVNLGPKPYVQEGGNLRNLVSGYPRQPHQPHQPHTRTSVRMETRGEKAGPVSPIQERTAAVKTQTLTALTAAVRTTRCPEKKVCAVEKQRELGRKQYQFSHWKRRNAKDELMAGIVGAGYYTALTMAAFADLGYYMVDWDKEELMSWGNHSGCKLLNDKCVSEGKTQYTDMFCTAESTDETRLQCTSDRHALGRCLLEELQPSRPQPQLAPQKTPPATFLPEFQYFADKKKGSPWRELMDFCPFITANDDTWCTDGDKEKMPGSIIAPNSRCVKGEELKEKDKNIGDVCVKVSCNNDVVSVMYRGSEKWHACAEGTKLNVDTTELKGRIVCPKYDDVCNTINRTLDAVEGPPPPPPPKPETQPDKPKADNPTTAKNPTDSFAQGTTVSTATTTTRTPSTQGNATPNKQESVTPNGNTKGATATGDAAAGTLGSKNNGAPIDPNAVPSLTNINSNSGVFSDIPHTDAVAAPAAEAAALFGPFVCLLLVTTMVALS